MALPTLHRATSLWRHGFKLAVIILAMPGWRAQAAPVSREAVLRDLAQHVLAAGYQELDARCRVLTNCAVRLAQAPAPDSLQAARQAWAAAASAANRVRFFQAGPIVDREYAAAFYYTRISPPLIDSEIQGTNALDQARLDGLGGDVKGLFGLEYLLFGHKGYPGILAPNTSLVLPMLSGKDSQRRRAYLVALARDLELKAGRLAEDWTAPGEQGAAAKFAAGGQGNLNVLVNQVAHAIEEVGENHVHFILVLPTPLDRQLYRIEGSPSGTSLDNCVAYLEGVGNAYRGAGGLGLADILQQVNATLAKRVDEQLKVALAATQAIGEPLEKAAVDKRVAVQNAYDQTHALEMLFKVDLASALGVTITILSSDGD